MKKLRGTKFRSRLEERVRNKLSDKWGYECEKLCYISEHEYNPDFTSGNVHLEVKGRFRTSGEARKYIDVRRANPNCIIIFVFQSDTTPMPGAKRRSDGTKRTMSEWATEKGFLWTTESEVSDKKIKELLAQ